MRPVTGYINAAELIENTDPRFGALRKYLPAVLLQSGKEPRGLLFSKHEVQEAGERWDANPEDQVPFEPEQVRIDRAVAIARRDERAQLVAWTLIERAGIKRRALLAGVAIGAGAALIVVGLIRVLL